MDKPYDSYTLANTSPDMAINNLNAQINRPHGFTEAIDGLSSNAGNIMQSYNGLQGINAGGLANTSFGIGQLGLGLIGMASNNPYASAISSGLNNGISALSGGMGLATGGLNAAMAGANYFMNKNINQDLRNQSNQSLADVTARYNEIKNAYNAKNSRKVTGYE